MHDHLHLLVHGQSETADCKRFVTLAKQYSGYHYSKEIGGRLWQRYGYERTLRNDEHTLTVARYIVENPLRAKLVASVEEYPFVGSLVCELKDLLLSLPGRRRPRKAVSDLSPRKYREGLDVGGVREQIEGFDVVETVSDFRRIV